MANTTELHTDEESSFTKSVTGLYMTKSEILEGLDDLRSRIELTHNEYYGDSKKILGQIDRIRLSFSRFVICEANIDKRLKGIELLVLEHEEALDRIEKALDQAEQSGNES